jgi:hypothetical protein
MALVTTAQEPPMIVGGTTSNCYQLIEKGKDVYSCRLDIRATQNPFVKGYFDWSPHQKDGAHGILTNGKLENGLWIADFVYMIEGNVQVEEVYFKRENDKLTQLTGELVEKGNKMVAKNLKKLKPTKVLKKVDCSKLDKVIKNIDAMKSQLVAPK